MQRFRKRETWLFDEIGFGERNNFATRYLLRGQVVFNRRRNWKSESCIVSRFHLTHVGDIGCVGWRQSAQGCDTYARVRGAIQLYKSQCPAYASSSTRKVVSWQSIYISMKVSLRGKGVRKVEASSCDTRYLPCIELFLELPLVRGVTCFESE